MIGDRPPLYKWIKYCISVNVDHIIREGSSLNCRKLINCASWFHAAYIRQHVVINKNK